ncbi:MAG: hypothetical protein NT068_03895 [Candidatus Nomurabacteria bacterium]|nr:hypothetical protein [Candidatus Nomurabacteria bacterium]
MLKVIYAPIFVRKFEKLEKDLQDEAFEKIELFKDSKNHESLKVHKLHGRFKNQYSFYVNYKIRIVFEWQNKDEVAFLVIGDHDLYK